MLELTTAETVALINIIQTRGRWFGVVYTKANGDTRILNAKTYVDTLQHLQRGKAMVTVYERETGYRNLYLNRVKRLTLDGRIIFFV